MSLLRGRRALVVACTAVLAAAVPVVGQSPAPGASLPAGVSAYNGATPGSGTGLKIGYISLGESIPFVSVVSKSLADQAAIAGADFVPCDSEVAADKALACAQNLKTQQVDGLLNFQLYENAAAQICAEGPQVPVIAIDIHQAPCEKAFVGADNTRAGVVLGEAVGQAVKDAFDCKVDAVVLMTAQAAGAVVKARADGTVVGYKNICGDPINFTAIDVPSIAIDEARTKFSDYLTTVPDAKKIIVMSLNDDMALGSLAAATNANRADQVWIGAHGGDKTAWQNIHCNPHWIGDVAYFPEKYGSIAIPAIIDAIKGNPVPADEFINHVALNAGNIAQYYPDVPAC
jgi:ribose transport system substrate-binding protein